MSNTDFCGYDIEAKQLKLEAEGIWDILEHAAEKEGYFTNSPIFIHKYEGMTKDEFIVAWALWRHDHNNDKWVGDKALSAVAKIFETGGGNKE